MSIVNQKREVFGNIAALRTLNEAYPDLKLNSSFPSITNDTNSSDFLIDLLKALIGYEELRELVVDTIVYHLPEIEQNLKKTLKRELKSLVSCGVDPSIPAFALYSGSGCDVELKKLDYYDIMKVDPQSQYGNLLYDDPHSGANSSDYNTVLYSTVQSQVETLWGQTTTNTDILALNFNPIGTTQNNIVNIKASPQYSTGAKTLTDLNNDYIDSISLFGSDKMITNIVDSLFGSLSSSFDKSQTQLENEAKLNRTFECILNADSNTVIDDSFFSFSNDDIVIIENEAKNRRQGIRKLETCTSTQSSVSINTLQEISTQLSGTCVGCAEQKDIVSSGIDNMANEVTFDEPNIQNRYSVQLNFVELLLKKLMSAMISFVISPKVVSIFMLNYKIIYGPTEDFDDGVDFMRKNKTLMKNIANATRDEILSILLAEATKSITELVAVNAAKSQAARSKQQTAQLLSLVGVPQEVLRLITGLG